MLNQVIAVTVLEDDLRVPDDNHIGRDVVKDFLGLLLLHFYFLLLEEELHFLLV